MDVSALPSASSTHNTQEIFVRILLDLYVDVRLSSGQMFGNVIQTRWLFLECRLPHPTLSEDVISSDSWEGLTNVY